MALQTHLYTYGSDNYGVLLHSAKTGETASVDAGDAGALLAALEETGWNLTEIWITHHHADHRAGLEEVKSRTGCSATGPKSSGETIPSLDRLVSGGDSFVFSGSRVEIISTPGHTLDMINYYLPDNGLVFTGDTLFVMGCGRIFEGDPEMMWQSLQALASLPPETKVYCGHEYTLANTEFALSVDRKNADLADRAERMKSLRDRREPTVPTTIGEELLTNPFLRAHDKSIRQELGLEAEPDAQVFGEMRRRKDAF